MLTFRSRERIPCTIISFADGDTVLVLTECIVCGEYKKQYVRLKGIEAHELRSENRPKALATAQSWTEKYAGKRCELICTQNSSDRYGRVVGDIIIDGFHLTELLVKSGDAWLSNFTNRRKKHER
jgi:endonuclease YncB( thermonuclease family)